MNNLFDKVIAITMASVAILVFVITIAFIAFIPLAIKDQEATIKIKEKLAEDGIVITETQIQKMIKENL